MGLQAVTPIDVHSQWETLFSCHW